VLEAFQPLPVTNIPDQYVYEAFENVSIPNKYFMLLRVYNRCLLKFPNKLRSFASLETILSFKTVTSMLFICVHFSSASYEEIKSLFLKQEESLFSSGREMIANVENNQWLNSNSNNVENCMTYFYLKLLGHFPSFAYHEIFSISLMSHITSCFSTSSRQQWSQISSMFSGRNSRNYL